MRHYLKEHSDIKAKEPTPRPIVSENKCQDWEPKFKNYLFKFLGMDGTFLSCIIRENDTPDVSETFTNYNEQFIGRAPLHGVSYVADSGTVYQLIVSFTNRCQSEDWIKPVEKYKDGRKSMKSLRDLFSREGNTSRWLKQSG